MDSVKIVSSFFYVDKLQHKQKKVTVTKHSISNIYHSLKSAVTAK